MAHPIAFVTRMPRDEEQAWLATLQTAMPGEQIISFREMTSHEREVSEIAIVANPDPADVAQLTGLTWIHSLWAGVERLVAELGVSAPPIVRLVDPELSRVMAEAVLAWTYYLQRDMPAYRKQQSEGVWLQREYRHPKDTRIGILGFGVLGKAAAARLVEAGFPVQTWSGTKADRADGTHFTGEDGLQTVLATSDILVCLLPLTSETRNLLDRQRLSSMPTGASIINFARGPIIVTSDLIELLDIGHLGHAVLDVFVREPLEESSPFWQHPAVTVLPHISAPTNAATAASIVAGNIEKWRRTGELPAAVNIERGY